MNDGEDLEEDLDVLVGEGNGITDEPERFTSSSASSSASSNEGDLAKLPSAISLNPISHAPASSTSSSHKYTSSLPPTPTIATLISHHTSKRMSERATKPGVSIASQRRFLGYFDRVVDGDDVRVGLEGKKIRLLWIKLSDGTGVKTPFGGKEGWSIAVQVCLFFILDWFEVVVD